jgi:predicted nucleic-acid-binding protein
MIALDVTVLVRYLAQDDAVQSPLATAVIEEQLSAHNPGFVSCLALAQLHAVLTRHYGVDRQLGQQRGAEIEAVFEGLQRVPRGLHIVEAQRLGRQQAAWNALQAFEDGFDFSAALLAELAAAAGCEATLSFDPQLARHPKARLLAPASASV